MASDPGLNERLAALVVDALELGGGKAERDVADELFAAFGVDLDAIDASVGQATSDRKTASRNAAAKALAAAAPSPEALMHETVRCGGRFIAMVEEIYRSLAGHARATAGSSEQFRFQRDGVDLDLTISEAFIERIRRLQQTLRRAVVGQVDEVLLSRFTRWDGGELYGTWPLDSGDLRLLDAVLNLSWMERLAGPGAPPEINAALAGARAAAIGLVGAAERLIDAHMTGLAELAADGRSVDEIATALFINCSDRSRSDAEYEVSRLLEVGGLDMGAHAQYIVGLERDGSIGLRRHPGSSELQPAVADGIHYGSGVSTLAGFVAMWRSGMYARRGREAVEAEVLATNPDVIVAWLADVRQACDEATVWLETDVFRATGSIDEARLEEAFEEFLNLPLWGNRDLLYEIWILCATLRSCEETGWIVDLRGFEREGDTWVLGVRPTTEPVAVLQLARDSAINLEAWREPKRPTAGNAVTPDVTIATPGNHPHDLVVVEAKNKYNLADGSALAAALKYRNPLHPAATWVCNHCEARAGHGIAARNHGDAWRRIHLAGAFRPGNVPPEFAESLELALVPPSARARMSDLLLVVDVTASMTRRLGEVWEVLADAADRLSAFRSFSAVLYSDHGQREPFVTRDIGPFADLHELLHEIDATPSGHGYDLEEAEDAMRRAREIAEARGPLTVVVITDAPPHPPADCPKGIDFEEEVRALLATGSRCFVVDVDEGDSIDATWSSFDQVEHTTLAGLPATCAASCSR
jgi:hypothetical protein